MEAASFFNFQAISKRTRGFGIIARPAAKAISKGMDGKQTSRAEEETANRPQSGSHHGEETDT